MGVISCTPPLLFLYAVCGIFLIDKYSSQLLAANDASFKKLPERARFDFEDAIADPDVPSRLPARQTPNNAIRLLSAFTGIVFTESSTTLVETEEEGSAGGNEEIQSQRQRQIIAGYIGKERDFFFRTVWEIEINSLRVEKLLYKVSSWAQPELSGFLTRYSAHSIPFPVCLFYFFKKRRN
jgi:hypothetical protein